MLETASLRSLGFYSTVGIVPCTVHLEAQLRQPRETDGCHRKDEFRVSC